MSSEKVSCKSITESGVRCKLPVGEGKRYCHFHAQSNTNSAKIEAKSSKEAKSKSATKSSKKA